MFFRRPTLHSIDTAREMMEYAIHIASGFKHNKKYIPTEEEVEKFERFEKELWQHYCTARYIVRTMHQRAFMPQEEERPEDNPEEDMQE